MRVDDAVRVVAEARCSIMGRSAAHSAARSILGQHDWPGILDCTPGTDDVHCAPTDRSSHYEEPHSMSGEAESSIVLHPAECGEEIFPVVSFDFSACVSAKEHELQRAGIGD